MGYRNRIKCKLKLKNIKVVQQNIRLFSQEQLGILLFD